MPSHHPRKKIRSHPPTTGPSRMNSRAFNFAHRTQMRKALFRAASRSPGAHEATIESGWSLTCPELSGPGRTPHSLARRAPRAGAPRRAPTRPAQSGCAPEAGPAPRPPSPGQPGRARRRPRPHRARKQGQSCRRAGGRARPVPGRRPGNTGQGRGLGGRRAADTGEPAAPT